MIVTNDLPKLLKEKGLSLSALKRSGVISGSVRTRLAAGQPMSMETLDTLCRVLGCQPGNLIRYVPTEENR